MAIAEYILSVISRACNYSLSVLGLNLQYGITGLFNLGLAAFAMIGAYTTAILVTKVKADFFIVILAVMVITAIISFLIAIPSLRTRGDYFAIVTLGFAYVAYALVLNWNSEPIRGSLGIPAIKRPIIIGITFNSFEMLTILSVIMLAIVLFILNKIANSPYGRLLRAIRDDEDAALALGKNATKYKITVFVLGSVLAALGGALYGYWSTYIEPGQFTVIESVYILFAVILGGKGNLFGSLIGAFIFIILPEPLRFLNLPADLIGGFRQLILGVLLLIVVLYNNEGILPENKHIMRDNNGTNT